MVVTNNDENTKKKRGRRPKERTKEQLRLLEEKKIPKKRGRKPKNTEDKQENKLPKKRGRKPKLVINTQNNYPKKKIEDTVILHLPLVNLEGSNIPNSDLNSNFKYNPTINIPEPGSESTSIQYKILNNLDKDQVNKEIPTLSFENSDDSNFSFNVKNNIKYENVYSKKTYCFWDTCAFDGQVYGLPIRRENKDIYIFGTFCCPECVTAYNFNTLNDNNIWERYSMINELYSIDNEPVKIASSKLLIDKFGGEYSIEDYRKINSNNKVQYNVMLPPLISFIPSLEEIVLDIDYNYMSINKNKLKNLSEKYKIQKNKTLINKNSLENTMNLKYI